MKFVNQKKHRIFLMSAVVLMAVYDILYQSYSIFQMESVGVIFFIVELVLIWLFLWNLRKEKLKPFIKILVNYFFILFSIAPLLALILEIIELF